jgi:hypothetical protein
MKKGVIECVTEYDEWGEEGSKKYGKVRTSFMDGPLPDERKAR